MLKWPVRGVLTLGPAFFYGGFTMNTGNILLKVSDVAELLNVTPVYVRLLVQRGRIPSLKIEGCRRFDPREIDRWIKSQKEGPRV